MSNESRKDQGQRAKRRPLGIIASAVLAAAVALLWLGDNIGKLGAEVGEFDRKTLVALRDPDNLQVPMGPRWLLNYFRT